MKQADIYLIKGSSFSDQVQFCCRLAEKAFKQNMTMHIQTSEAYQNEALNEALWSYKAESFLPHAVGQGNAESAPITIDTSTLSHNNQGHRELLILLGQELPSNLNEFQRVTMIVPDQEELLSAARTNYKTLKTKRIDVKIHDLR